MAMAKQKKGHAEVDSTEWAGLLKLALEAMQQRGKAELGQKTVLDPLLSKAPEEIRRCSRNKPLWSDRGGPANDR